MNISLNLPLDQNFQTARRCKGRLTDDPPFASAGSDRRILLTTQGCQRLLVGHTDRLKSLAFSPDGSTLASAGGDRTIILWDVDLESWQEEACRLANCNLTLDEWNRFVGPEIPYRRTCPDLPIEEWQAEQEVGSREQAVEGT